MRSPRRRFPPSRAERPGRAPARPRPCISAYQVIWLCAVRTTVQLNDRAASAPRSGEPPRKGAPSAPSWRRLSAPIWDGRAAAEGTAFAGAPSAGACSRGSSSRIAMPSGISSRAAADRPRHRRPRLCSPGGTALARPGCLEVLTDLAQGSEPWAIPWPCVYEFLRVVTHRACSTPRRIWRSRSRIWDPCSSLPRFVLLGEGPAHASHLRRMVLQGRVMGNLTQDAHIAALVIEHGASEIWTADRDFARFPGLRIRNPFTDP